MNLILYFYLIHFLADYPFQPNSLVQMKKRGYWGVLIHCIIHLIVLVVILMPFLNTIEVWIGIGIIFGTHNIIDQAKVYLDKKYPKQSFLLYFLDQAVHLIIITGVALYVLNIMPNFPNDYLLAPYYINQSIILYLLILVLVTYFYDVTRYFVLKNFWKKKVASYKRNYQTMLWNVLITTVAFGVYWLT